ncbi:hypothetical protein BM536_028910 [Streptomyces phaeoluteigriseus]|uniref:Uncharacterized protein n=1 Tax=Streptomyces phaeoluteigriseus TaxID=114686 RepID=A0A1V6MM59_9ACTN|nr:hypothetical protein BM536_028910 [Streptomyces phaeoluteigriseus]
MIMTVRIPLGLSRTTTRRTAVSCRRVRVLEKLAGLSPVVWALPADGAVLVSRCPLFFRGDHGPARG